MFLYCRDRKTMTGESGNIGRKYEISMSKNKKTPLNKYANSMRNTQKYRFPQKL